MCANARDSASCLLRLLRYNWYYHTLPQAHMDNRVMYWPRGRVWGGSSTLNAMVYIRGHAEDYNRWQREGAQGWDYDHCLPYFRKAQCHELGEDRYGTKALKRQRQTYLFVEI